MMIAFMVIGAVFFLLGFFILLSEYQTRRRSRVVKGQIVGYSSGDRNKSSKSMYHAVAEFRNFDGQSYYVVSSTGFSRPVGQIGDFVQVYVRPNDLKFAAIQSKLGLILGSVLAVIGCVGFMAFLKFFSWDPISVTVSGLFMASLVLSILKLRRKVPLTKEQWALSRATVTSGKVFAIEQREEIPWISEMDFQEASRQARKMTRAAMPMTVGIAVVCGLGSLYAFQSTQKFLVRAVPGSGRVVEMYHPRGTKSSTYHPIVEFTAPGMSQTQRFEHPFSVNPPMYSVGEEVKILIDLEDPTHSKIDMGIWNFLISIITGVVACLFALISYSNMRSLEKFKGPCGGPSFDRRSSRGI